MPCPCPGSQACYTFDEGDGNVAGDSSGNGHDGTINGATWTTGKSGSGLSFDGVDDSVSVPCMNNGEISICAWFYKHANDTTRTDAVFGGYRHDRDAQMREGFDVRFDKGNPDVIRFVVVTQDGNGNRKTITTRKDLLNSVGNWYHVAGTYNISTGKQKLYINGQLVNTRRHPAGNTVVPLTYYSDMRIGYSRYKSGYFNGVIDNVRLFNRTLTDQEVLDIFNN